MTLAAAQVIDAVAAKLVPMVATGGRVYTSRMWPITQAELPAWRVFASDETVQDMLLDGSLREHRLGVTVEGYVRATADLDDALHSLAAAGLTLLFAAPVPYGLELASIRRQMDDGGEFAHGVISLQINAAFDTHPTDPETII